MVLFVRWQEHCNTIRSHSALGNRPRGLYVWQSGRLGSLAQIDYTVA